MKTRMRFLRHAESIGPMWPKSKSKPNPGAGTVPPPAGRPRAQVKERVGRAAPFSSSAMSSGRLSLDRVARQHCPSPFHRQAHPKSVPGSGTIDFQRTVNSVLTVCLSRGDNPSQSLTRRAALRNTGNPCTCGGILDVPPQFALNPKCPISLTYPTAR